MARITSQRAVEMIGNQYDMILIASARARQLAKGGQPMIKCENGNIVTALREIEQGLITREHLFGSKK